MIMSNDSECCTQPLNAEQNTNRSSAKSVRWLNNPASDKPGKLAVPPNAECNETFNVNDTKWLSLGTEVHCTAAANTIGVIRLTIGVFGMVVIVSKLNYYNAVAIFSCLANFFMGGCTIIGVCEEQPVLLLVYLVGAPLHVLKLSIAFPVGYHSWTQDPLQQNQAETYMFKKTALLAVLALTFILVEVACYHIMLRCAQYIRAVTQQKRKMADAAAPKTNERVISNAL